MLNEQSKTQYSRVANQAYLYVLTKKSNAIDAWQKAAEEIITSDSTRDKVCPRATFIGLCESGDLIGIAKTKQSSSPNYYYAKFAIEEWEKENTSKTVMWQKVKIKFPNGAKNHQGQLDVVISLWKYIMH